MLWHESPMVLTVRLPPSLYPVKTGEALARSYNQVGQRVSHWTFCKTQRQMQKLRATGQEAWLDSWMLASNPRFPKTACVTLGELFSIPVPLTQLWNEGNAAAPLPASIMEINTSIIMKRSDNKIHLSGRKFSSNPSILLLVSESDITLNFGFTALLRALAREHYAQNCTHVTKKLCIKVSTLPS